MMGLEWGGLFKIEPEKLLTQGNISEQFAAQHLTIRSPQSSSSELYYWLRSGKKGAAEVDFILAECSTIIPLEIKSGANGKMRSLWQLIAEKNLLLAVKLDLSYNKELTSQVFHKVQMRNETKQINCKLLTVPLYAIENICSLIEESI